MSRVYFHSEARTAELRGSERAHCGVTCSDVALALLSPERFGDDPVKRLIPSSHHLHRSPGPFSLVIGAAFAVGDLEFVLPDGRSISAFHASLNSVVAAGGDVLRLMARIHGQCEVHGYVEGPNRAWLAGLIEAGREVNLLRPDQGWDDVVALLVSSSTEPVVTSYSVCEQFPNPGIVGLVEEQDQEAWYDLPRYEQWEQALAVLRSRPDALLEWRPDNWADVRFGEGITVMELRAIANRLTVQP